MKRRVKYAALALLALLVLGILGSRFIHKEPVYNGKTATEWIKEFGRPPTIKVSGSGSPGSVFSRNAVAFIKINTVTSPPQTLVFATNISVSGVTSYNRLILTGNVFSASPAPAIPMAQGSPVGNPVYMFTNFAPGSNAQVARIAQIQQVLQQLQAGGSLFPGQSFVVSGSPGTVISVTSSQSDAAFLALREMGPPAIPYLIRALERKQNFMDDLHDKLWLKSPPRIQTNYLSAPYPAVQLRRSAARLLGMLGSDAAAAIPALTRAFEDADPEVRKNAVEAIGTMGPAAKSAVPALIKILSAPQSMIDQEAFVALDRIGFDSVDLSRAVEQWMHTRLNNFQIKNLLQSRNLRGPEAARALGRLLPVWTGQMRYDILSHLERTGPNAVKVVPQLMNLLHDPDAETRYLAVRALGGIGAGAKPAIPELEKMTADEMSRYPHAISRAIRKINGIDRPED